MSESLEVKATVKRLPISPQKIRLVVDVVRGMKAVDALDTLRYMPQKGAEPVFKLVQSAIANAENNFGLDADDLVIKTIFASDGPRHNLRPYGGRFGGRGRFKPIINRYAHVTVVLTERDAE